MIRLKLMNGCKKISNSALITIYLYFTKAAGQAQYSKVDTPKLLLENKAQIAEHSRGKSEIWQMFGNICHDNQTLNGYVACKACKKVYVYQPCDGTQSLRKHNCDIGTSGPVAKSKPVAVNLPLSGLLLVLNQFKKHIRQ